MIRRDQKRLFFDVRLYPLSFFANTPFKAVKTRHKALRHFKVDPVLKINAKFHNRLNLTCQYIRRNSWRSVQHCLNRKQGLTNICCCRSPRLTHTRAGTFWMIGTLFEEFTILLLEEPCCRYIQAQNKGRAQGHVLPLLPLKGVGTLSKTKQKKRK